MVGVVQWTVCVVLAMSDHHSKEIAEHLDNLLLEFQYYIVDCVSKE